MSTGVQNLYADFGQFAALRGSAQRHEQQALDSVVEQFESVFVQMVLGSMREASKPLQSDLFASDAMEMYQQMHDQQLGLHLSQQGGIGLADIMLDQISQHYQVTTSANGGNRD